MDYVLNLTNNGLGYIFVDFLTNSSGHPALVFNAETDPRPGKLLRSRTRFSTRARVQARVSSSGNLSFRVETFFVSSPSLGETSDDDDDGNQGCQIFHYLLYQNK
jgi:hypothetical protein